MPRGEEAYLLDIVIYSRRALRAVEGKSLEQVLADEVAQDLVVCQFFRIGEAIKSLPDSFKEARPRIPWKQLSRSRDVLARRYWRLNLEQLYRLTTVELPRIISELEPLVPDPQPPSPKEPPA